MDLIPVEGDPFGESPPAQPRVNITIRPHAPSFEPVDYDPFANAGPASAASSPGPVIDAVKSFGAAIPKGVSSLVGLPDAVSQLWQKGGDAVLDVMESSLGLPKGWAAETKAFIAQGRKQGMMANLPTSAGARKTIEDDITGPLYEPQTTAGRYADTVGQMVPAAVGGGGVVRNLFNFALIPGIASEAAGQATKGTALEEPARIGAALVSSAGASLLNRPSAVERALRSAMSAEVTPATVDQAARLIDDAAARGITLTWAEALEQVAPGTGLTNLQRVVESTAGGREVFGPHMGARPAQVEAAARQSFDQIAPPNFAPTTIGPAVGQTAEGVISDVRAAINRASDPLYRQSESVLLTPQEMANVNAIPGVPEMARLVRNTPQLNRYVAHLPDNSVGFLNEVKKQLNIAAENAAAPINSRRNGQIAAGYETDANAVRDAARRASPEYGEALDFQARAREQFLDPLLQGYIGRLAKADITTQRAIAALFPDNPLPNSADEISRTVSVLARRSPRVTRDLIRAHAEATFNEAAQNLQAGANQAGGASFARDLVGNAQQRANLEAAIRASGPDGDEVWRGFDRFLEIAQAIGKRQPVGSKTAFNTQDISDLSTGGTLANSAKLALAPAKWTTKVSDLWSRWQLGRNVGQAAEILVDPNSRALLRAIAARPADSREAAIIAGRLAIIASQSNNKEKR